MDDVVTQMADQEDLEISLKKYLQGFCDAMNSNMVDGFFFVCLLENNEGVVISALRDDSKLNELIKIINSHRDDLTKDNPQCPSTIRH